MKTDTGYPHKLESTSEIPEQLSDALRNHLSAIDSVPLLLYAPSRFVGDEEVSATILAVTNDGWLVAAEKQDGGIGVEHSKFNDTLFLELTSIVLWGQLKIAFASAGTWYTAVTRFSTVAEGLYREAVDLLLDGIDRTDTSEKEERGTAEVLKDWPLKFRNEVLHYLPKDSVYSPARSGRRFLAVFGANWLLPAHYWSPSANSF